MSQDVKEHDTCSEAGTVQDKRELADAKSASFKTTLAFVSAHLWAVTFCVAGVAGCQAAQQDQCNRGHRVSLHSAGRWYERMRERRNVCLSVVCGCDSRSLTLATLRDQKPRKDELVSQTEGIGSLESRCSDHNSMCCFPAVEGYREYGTGSNGEMVTKGHLQMPLPSMIFVYRIIYYKMPRSIRCVQECSYAPEARVANSSLQLPQHLCRVPLSLQRKQGAIFMACTLWWPQG